MDDILTVEGLAERLDISLFTARRMARHGEIPGAFRVGRSWRFTGSGLAKFVAARQAAEASRRHKRSTRNG